MGRGKRFARRDEPSDGVPVFCIVTPVYNGADYIDDTIYSVLSQAGDFVLHYHVQDGGSTDDTMERVRRWEKLSRKLPAVCRKLVFTYASGADTGMYDAIVKAFRHALPPGEDVVMGWIAADDRVAPGACATISGIRTALPETRFLGGRVALLDGTGAIIGVHPIYPYSRACMAAGLYDGRALPFVMQEGSFWCADLWRKAGGLDTRFRLAGDWDLWRRMAVHAPYIIADTILGFHRRRPGQLSEQMGTYYGEVDALLDSTERVELPEILALSRAADVPPIGQPPLRTTYDRIAAEYEIIKTNGPRFRVSLYAATVVQFNLEHKQWQQMHGFGALAVAPELVRIDGATTSKTVLLKRGFSPPEGPYPEYGMPLPVRWMSGPFAEGEVTLTEPGRYRVVLRCRSWAREQSATILVDGKPLGRLAVNRYGHDRDIQLSAEGMFGVGVHVIGVAVEQPNAAERHLLFIDWVIEQLPRAHGGAILPTPLQTNGLATRAATPPVGAWPRITIVVPTRNQGHFIHDTFNSIIAQGYPNLELIVVDGSSTDETPRLLREYTSHITHLIAEPDRGQSDAINKGIRVATGEILSWLNSDDLLADGALYAIAHAFMTSDADMVAGVCDVFDDRNVILHRHLPCLPDGPLPLADILDIENKWLRGAFFHQPEVFFRRATWERAGGRVEESLFYSMDYDLWARMARAGATIRVIGATIARFRMHRDQKTSSIEAYGPELRAHAALLREEQGLSVMSAQIAVRHQLKIVFFNDYGLKYGAGIAHRRLAEAFAAAGHEIVALAYADFDHGNLQRRLSTNEVTEAIVARQPDLVFVGNLHAIASDFDLLGALARTGLPTIFYAHDQWIATGRCGYTGGCLRYMTQCNEACPTADLYPSLPPLEVAPAYTHKRSVLATGRDSKLVIFTNSNYMQGFLAGALDPTGRPPIYVAPIGIDTRAFVPGDRWRARMVLDLPQDRFVVMTAAADLADARKGLQLLLGAIEGLAEREDILLLIMGFGEPLPYLPFEVRYTGYLTDEDVITFHYQAADLFVGPSIAEAFGQTYIEAGACGVPSVAFDVGGVSDAILNGVTGLLATELSAAALCTMIGRLRADSSLRRQMGIQARLHVCNHFSVEASAAKMTAILVGEAGLGLILAPTVSLLASPEPVREVHYLVEAAVTSAMPPPLRWIPRSNFSEETIVAQPGGLAPRYWWGIWPQSRFIVRAEEDGPHMLKLAVRCPFAGQRIAISVNRGADLMVDIDNSDLDVLQQLRLPVDLVKGLNRIDIGYAVFHTEDSGTYRNLTLLFEDVAIIAGSPDLVGAPKDGAYELVAGFDQEEGPYPDMGLPSKFHWAVGQSCKVRIFSAFSGSRVWELQIRNAQRDQRLTIKVNNTRIMPQLLHDVDLTTPIVLRFEARVDIGYHVVTIESSRRTSGDGDPRQMAFIFEELRLCDVGDQTDAIVDETRWELSDGFGGEEPADAAIGNVHRWVTSRKASLVLERAKAGVALLSLKYRSPVRGQTALLQVNGRPAGRLDLTRNNFQPGFVEARLSLNRGQNLVEFQFLHARASSGDTRELVLLVEHLDVRELSGAGANVIEEPALPTYECVLGFSEVENPVQQFGLGEEFRWSIGGESIVRFSEPVSRATLLVRNDRPGQVLEIISETGSEVARAALFDDLAILQEVKIDLGAAGSRMMKIRPRMVSAGNTTDPRHLAIIVEAIADEHGRRLHATN